MERHYAYLGSIAVVLAIIGLMADYLMPTYMYGSYASVGLFIIGFIIMGYGLKAWKWPVWIGSILVMIAFIATGNALVLWFIFAAGLGLITYSYRQKSEMHMISK